MKKNLSKNMIKAMAVGLAITMGSSIAISGVSGNLLGVSANTNTANIKNPNFETSPIAEDNYVITSDGVMLKIIEVSTLGDANDEAGGKALIVGVSNSQITAEKMANGVDTPFLGELANGVLTVTGGDGSDKLYKINAETIGDGTIFSNTDSITSTDVYIDYTNQKELFTKVLSNIKEIAANAFSEVDIRGTSGTDYLQIPATLTKIGANAFGGPSSDSFQDLYLDLSEHENFDDIAANAFDSSNNATDRSITIKLKGNAERDTLSQKLENATNTNIKLVEKEAPTILSAEYSQKKSTGEYKITLTASEKLKVDTIDGFSVKKDGQEVNGLQIVAQRIDDTDETTKDKVILTLNQALDPGNYTIEYTKASNPVKDNSENELDNITGNTVQFTAPDQDITAPAVSSIEITDAEKTAIMLTFDEEISVTAADLKSVFTVKKDGADVAITNAAKEGDNAIKIEIPQANFGETS